MRHLKSTYFVMLLTMGTASAHFSLVSPPSALLTDNGGKGGPPCAEGVASNIVTEVLGGHPLPIALREFVYHPGHYRIALSVKSRSELPPDPDVVEADGSSISATIQRPARIPALADGLFVHNTPPNGEWRTEIILPNLNCEKCTLQISEFMAEHGAPFFYHHCADLKIKADPSLPAADSAWPRADISSSRQTNSVLAHVADGGGWQTSITLVNLDSVPAAYTLTFWGDDGNNRAVNGTINVNGSKTIQSDGSPPGTATGWAELSSPQSVDGTAIFRLQGGEAEVAVPLLLSGGRKLVVPFENGPGLALGIAVTNISPTENTTISVTLRNEQGEVVSTLAPILLARRQHTSFVLPVPPLQLRGVVEFASTNADIMALGIRSNNGAVTSIRAFNK